MATRSNDRFFEIRSGVLPFLPVMRPLLFIWALLVAADLAVIPFDGAMMVRILDLDDERSFGTWFSILLLASGGLLSLITAHQIRPRDRGLAAGWALVGAIMLAMSAEELLALHESTILRLRAAFGASGYLHFAWVIVGAPLALAVILAGWPMIRRLSPALRGQLMVAAAVFLVGAIGAELIGGKIASLGMQDGFLYAVTTSLEEALEILAVLVGIDAILRFRRQADLRVAI